MKLVIAIVKPFKVPEIVDEVAHDPEFPGLTVVDARGFGRGKTRLHAHSRDEDLRDFIDHSVILVATAEDHLDAVVERIRSTARTGTEGDGKVFVLDLHDAIRIASGERGEEALQ